MREYQAMVRRWAWLAALMAVASLALVPFAGLYKADYYSILWGEEKIFLSEGHVVSILYTLIWWATLLFGGLFAGTFCSFCIVGLETRGTLRVAPGFSGPENIEIEGLTSDLCQERSAGTWLEQSVSRLHRRADRRHYRLNVLLPGGLVAGLSFPWSRMYEDFSAELFLMPLWAIIPLLLWWALRRYSLGRMAVLLLVLVSPAGRRLQKEGVDWTAAEMADALGLALGSRLGSSVGEGGRPWPVVWPRWLMTGLLRRAGMPARLTAGDVAARKAARESLVCVRKNCKKQACETWSRIFALTLLPSVPSVGRLLLTVGLRGEGNVFSEGIWFPRLDFLQYSFAWLLVWSSAMAMTGLGGALWSALPEAAGLLSPEAWQETARTLAGLPLVPGGVFMPLPMMAAGVLGLMARVSAVLSRREAALARVLIPPEPEGPEADPLHPDPLRPDPLHPDPLRPASLRPGSMAGLTLLAQAQNAISVFVVLTGLLAPVMPLMLSASVLCAAVAAWAMMMACRISLGRRFRPWAIAARQRWDENACTAHTGLFLTPSPAPPSLPLDGGRP